MAEVETKEAIDNQEFLSCSRHGRRNAFGKIICKCQIGNPDATEHTKDCTIVTNESQEGKESAVKTDVK